MEKIELMFDSNDRLVNISLVNENKQHFGYPVEELSKEEIITIERLKADMRDW